MTFCGKKCNKNQGAKLPCELINKSEKVFFVMYLELLKIPFEIQLMKILEKVPFAAVSISSVFFLIDEFCKSYSLTFVNLLLQKLAGSKFSHP